VIGQLVFVTFQADNKGRQHFSIRHVEFYNLVRSTAFFKYLVCGTASRVLLLRAGPNIDPMRRGTKVRDPE
jgi:hypothetical protein